MAGNASEWVLVAYAPTYTNPCVDCANVVRIGPVILHVLTTTPKAEPGSNGTRDQQSHRQAAQSLPAPMKPGDTIYISGGYCCPN
jgi:hypothetical protein